jgi:hypothetical protein
MGGVDLLEVLHALNARGEERRVAERLEHRFAWRGNRDFTDDIQNTASLAVNIGPWCEPFKRTDFVASVDNNLNGT